MLHRAVIKEMDPQLIEGSSPRNRNHSLKCDKWLAIKIVINQKTINFYFHL